MPFGNEIGKIFWCGVDFPIASVDHQTRSILMVALLSPIWLVLAIPLLTDWFKVWMADSAGMVGVLLNANANAWTSAGAFNQGHNLHILTNTHTASYVIPVFPPGC